MSAVRSCPAQIERVVDVGVIFIEDHLANHFTTKHDLNRPPLRSPWRRAQPWSAHARSSWWLGLNTRLPKASLVAAKKGQPVQQPSHRMLSCCQQRLDDQTGHLDLAWEIACRRRGRRSRSRPQIGPFGLSLFDGLPRRLKAVEHGAEQRIVRCRPASAKRFAASATADRSSVSAMRGAQIAQRKLHRDCSPCRRSASRWRCKPLSVGRLRRGDSLPACSAPPAGQDPSLACCSTNRARCRSATVSSVVMMPSRSA